MIYFVVDFFKFDFSFQLFLQAVKEIQSKTFFFKPLGLFNGFEQLNSNIPLKAHTILFDGPSRCRKQ